jgi:hypothetical protein
MDQSSWCGHWKNKTFAAVGEYWILESYEVERSAETPDPAYRLRFLATTVRSDGAPSTREFLVCASDFLLSTDEGFARNAYAKVAERLSQPDPWNAVIRIDSDKQVQILPLAPTKLSSAPPLPTM